MTELHSPAEFQSLLRAQRIDRWCDDFETEWQSGERPDWREWLERAPVDERRELLAELLPLDLAYRLRCGERPVVGDYSSHVPATDRMWLTELVESQLRELGARAQASRDSEGMLSCETLLEKRAALKTTIASACPASPPDYEILGELGRGAMGVVYLARHARLRRAVALKMVLAGGHASSSELARFRAEAEASARLHHPHIVQIYDYGEHEGRPYLSLEYVAGGTLAEQTSGVAQPPRDAAQLVETLARAVQHAHELGIVHRDLKPANVLMSSHGVPKITDFGLAKQVESAQGATTSGMLLGTPRYMAPEQAAGQSHAAGPAVDIHALGAILYELLTGRPPFQAASLTALFAQIRDCDATPPSRLQAAVPRDLETICLKCLQKLPDARYSSAAELADDLRRFLADEPIRARAVSSGERAWRWCRRNPRLAVLEGALVTVLLAVTLGALFVADRFRRVSAREQASARVAEASRLETRLELARSQLTVARMLRRGERVGQFHETATVLAGVRDELKSLGKAGFAVPEADWNALRNEAASALLVPDLRVSRRWPRRASQLQDVASDGDRGRLARKSTDGKVLELLRYESHEPYASLESPDGSTLAHFCFSSDGSRLAASTKPPGTIHVWDVANAPRFVRSFPATHDWPMMDHSGRLMAFAAGESGARVVRIDDGETLAESTDGLPATYFPFHPRRPWLTLLTERSLAVFDYEQGETRWKSELPPTSVAKLWKAEWNADGSALAVVSDRGTQMIDGATGTAMGPSISSLDTSGLHAMPMGRTQLVATTDWSGNLRLFNSQTGRLQFRAALRFFQSPRGHESLRFSLGYEGEDYVEWEVREGCQREFAYLGSDYYALSRAGDLLVVHRSQRDSAIYSLPSGEWLADLPEEFGDVPLGFEAGDRALLAYGRGHLVRLPIERSQAETGEEVIRFGPPASLAKSSMRERWSMNSEGTRIVIPGYDQGGYIVHLSPDKHQAQPMVKTSPQNDARFATISPTGEFVVLGSHVRGEVVLYDPQDGRRVRTISASAGTPVFSPLGRWLVVQRPAGGVDVYKTSDWTLRKQWPGMAAVFSDDEQWLAVNVDSNWIAFYETSTWREIGRLEVQDPTRVVPVAFTRDNSGLIALAIDPGRLLYIDLARLRAELQTLDLDWKAPSLPAGRAVPRVRPVVEFCN